MRLLVVVVAAALAAVAARAVAASPSGLHGHVRRGPITPVCRADTACDGPAVHIKLEFTRGGVTRSVTTDGAGRYSIQLAAGRWSVRIPKARFGYSPRIVVVRADIVLTQNFFIDTGIR